MKNIILLVSIIITSAYGMEESTRTTNAEKPEFIRWGKVKPIRNDYKDLAGAYDQLYLRHSVFTQPPLLSVSNLVKNISFLGSAIVLGTTFSSFNTAHNLLTSLFIIGLGSFYKPQAPIDRLLCDIGNARDSSWTVYDSEKNKLKTLSLEELNKVFPIDVPKSSLFLLKKKYSISPHDVDLLRRSNKNLCAEPGDIELGPLWDFYNHIDSSEKNYLIDTLENKKLAQVFKLFQDYEEKAKNPINNLKDIIKA